jgi:hypothetical protein
MPIRPQESIKEQLRTNGSPIKVHEFIVAPDDSIELGIVYNDFPRDLPNIASVGSTAFFDTLQTKALNQLGEGRLIYAVDGQFASHPMREIRLEVPERNLVYQTRIIVVGNRIYQLIVVSSTGVDVSQEVETLFNSFSLIYYP